MMINAVDIGIMCAMAEELNPLKEIFNRTGTVETHTLEDTRIIFYTVEYNGLKIAIMEAGVGLVDASIAAITLIRHCNPCIMLFYGIAGAPFPPKSDIKIGDIVIASKSFDDTALTHKKMLENRLDISEIMKEGHSALIDVARKVAVLSKITIHDGVVMSSNSFPKPPNHMELVETYNIVAVDMETAAFYQACELYNIPHLCVRSISNWIVNNESINEKQADFKLADITAANFCFDLVKHISENKREYIINNPLKILTEESFKFIDCIDGLKINNPILKQHKVVTRYRDKHGIIRSVPAKHGVIIIFTVDRQYYVLGHLTKNPETKVMELSAGIGGYDPVAEGISFQESLRREIRSSTSHTIDLSDLKLSTKYVCHRDPAYRESTTCFIKTIALFKKEFSEFSELRELVTEINKHNHIKNPNMSYGIYELHTVVMAAHKTAGKDESPDKERSQIINYTENSINELIIFDDNAVSAFFQEKGHFGEKISNIADASEIDKHIITHLFSRTEKYKGCFEFPPSCASIRNAGDECASVSANRFSFQSQSSSSSSSSAQDNGDQEKEAITSNSKTQSQDRTRSSSPTGGL